MRISRDLMLMEVAQAVAKRGTCSRKQVGVVVAREGRVLVTGYNGAPAGLTHCGHEIVSGLELIQRGGRWKTFLGDEPYSDSTLARNWYLTQVGDSITVTNELQTCPVAVHSEANAIAFAAKYGMSLDRADLYTTWSPCLPCAKLIINAGILKVYMAEMYHDNAGYELLNRAEIRTYLVG